MPVNLLSDVDVVAVSLVDKAANRKRFYLRKAEDSEELLTLPGPHYLLKTDDWSVVYSVVAEPGWRENAGAGSPGESTEDEWADEDEIRSAAHRFMKNGALVNEMHRSLEPYGRVVENFVAQSDFEVDGELVKAGSWVIGIEPSEQGRAKIEAGEFTGVSIQGTGLRTLDISKKVLGSSSRNALPGSAFVFPKERRYPIHDRKHAANALARASGKPEEATVRKAVCSRYPDLPSCKTSVKKKRGPGGDIARNQGKQFGPLRHLIAFYLKKPHPFTACVRDNRKRFGPRAENVCAALKDIGLQTTHWRSGGKMKMSKAADVPEEMYGQALVIWKHHGLSEEDAQTAWEGVMDDQERSLLAKIGEKLGIKADDDCGCGPPEETSEGKVAGVDITKEEFATLTTKVDTTAEVVEKSSKAVEALANRVADIAEALANSKKKDDDEGEQPDPAEEVYHRLDDVAKSVEAIRGDVDKLAKGQSAQPAGDNGKVEKSHGDWKVGLFD